MPSFHFRLAAVLRLRERVKEETEFNLCALNLEQARRELEIAELSNKLDGLGADVGGQIGMIFSPIALKLQDDYAQLLARRIEQKRRALMPLREEIAAKQQELTEAAREVKSLEILRGRLADKFRREQNVAEQKFLDELGQRGFARRDRRQ